MASNTEEWLKLELAELPSFTTGNMTSYFVTRLAGDGKAANDFKNLNKHAFPLFKAGHIQSILVSHSKNIFIIKCYCLPEMKKNIVYRIELKLDTNGDIIGGKCGCPAGAGPCATCKHVSALCYALEEYSRIKELRQPDSCTSQLQHWNQPRKRRLESHEVDDISFVKDEHGKTKKTPQSMVYDPRPPELQKTTAREISTLRDTLANTGIPSSFLHLLPLPNLTGTSLNTCTGQ